MADVKDGVTVLIGDFDIRGDVALIKAERSDHWGNLTHCQAAVQLRPGDDDDRPLRRGHGARNHAAGRVRPRNRCQPGIFVNKLVCTGRVAVQADNLKAAA